MRAAIMSINTRHYSFLEGYNLSCTEDNNFNYRMSIHKLRIGTFAGLLAVAALTICI